MLVLKTDYRIGGNPRYYIAEENEQFMQVPDEVKKCVVFIGCKTVNGVVWGGTGFFLGIPVDGFSGRYFNYIVTAKHSIDAIKATCVNEKVLIRINLKTNSAQIIESSIEEWKFHPTEESSVDVAVLAWSPPEPYDFLSIPTDTMTVSEALIKEQGIGAGDEVFLTGLFRLHYGTQRNLPIIRTGNIALMPEEKVPVKNWDDTDTKIDAYLVEGRSIGGLSGSPVFLYLGVIRNVDGSVKFVTGSKGGAFYWLGLMRGHWAIPEGTVDAIMDNNGIENKSVNVGIAIVVPASKILEVINRDDFMKARKQTEEDLKKQNAPTLDFGGNEPTKEIFEETLKKVSQKIKPSEPSPSKPKT